MLWALINQSELTYEYRNIEIIFTGTELQGNVERKYLSTIQLENNIVIHVFEKLSHTTD